MTAMPAFTVRRLAPLALAAALLALGACQHAPPPTPSASSPSAATAPSGEGGKDGKCYQGCVTWGEACNADPRGVYKCQRRCEKFGEICE